MVVEVPDVCYWRHGARAKELWRQARQSVNSSTPRRTIALTRVLSRALGRRKYRQTDISTYAPNLLPLDSAGVISNMRLGPAVQDPTSLRSLTTREHPTLPRRLIFQLKFGMSCDKACLAPCSCRFCLYQIGGRR